MKPDDPEPKEGTMPAGTDSTILEDLRLRLLGSQEQEQAARAAVHRLSRELALMHRLAKFSEASAPTLSRVQPGEIPRRSAAAVSTELIYNVDLCEDRGEYTFIAGWAFHPAPGWNGRDAVVTVLLRDGTTTYYAPAGRLPRLDVAAHYAAHPPQDSGHARGLDGVGFVCEILHDSLPAGRTLQLALRLECGTMICEAPTGQSLTL